MLVLFPPQKHFINPKKTLSHRNPQPLPLQNSKTKNPRCTTTPLHLPLYMYTPYISTINYTSITSRVLYLCFGRAAIARASPDATRRCSAVDCSCCACSSSRPSVVTKSTWPRCHWRSRGTACDGASACRTGPGAGPLPLPLRPPA